MSSITLALGTLGLYAFLKVSFLTLGFVYCSMRSYWFINMQSLMAVKEIVLTLFSSNFRSYGCSVSLTLYTTTVSWACLLFSLTMAMLIIFIIKTTTIDDSAVSSIRKSFFSLLALVIRLFLRTSFP